MKMEVTRKTFRIDKNKMGGSVTVTISGHGPAAQSCRFTYGDPEFDYCASLEEAEKAALNYMHGARAMFEVIRLHMNLTSPDFNELQQKVSIRKP